MTRQLNKDNSSIYSVLRAKDWRYSFLPFVAGCLYLFMVLFDLTFEKKTLLFLLSFLISAIGFASTGYLINEFFDIESDTKAEKVNSLSKVSKQRLLLLFTLSLTVLFIPWIWLPSDPISWILIFSEIALLLSYSLPLTRLKNVYWISGVIDSLYAYVIPLLLVTYSCSIFSGKSTDTFIVFFLLSMFFFGFRNILIHQSRDIDYDIKAGIMTLPQKLGEKKTNFYLMFAMILEIIFFCFFCVLLSIEHSVFFFWLIVFAGIIVLSFFTKKTKIKEENLSDESKYTFTDKAYQLWFPLFNLLIIVYHDWRWLLILPLHIFLFIPRFRLEVIYFLAENIFVKLKTGYHFVVLHFFSRPINYLIYYFFRLFNVDLRKKNMSACSFLLTFLNK